jgi:hypothetical protein
VRGEEIEMETKGSPNSSPTIFRVNPPNNNNIKKLVEVKPFPLSDRELLEIFPEAKEIIPEKVKEWQEKEKEIKKVIKYKLRLIRNRVKDTFSRWFWREVVKMYVGDELLEVERQIQRLKRLKFISQYRQHSLALGKKLTQEKINQARLMPIVDIASSFLRMKKSGKNYLTLCPFHQEKHPSFYLYPDTNSFYCFGCNRGGDVIKFVELHFVYDFKQAVEYLTRR